MALSMLMAPCRSVRSGSATVVPDGVGSIDPAALIQGTQGIDAAALITDGSFFGEISLLLAMPRTASILALTTCSLCSLTQVDLVMAYIVMVSTDMAYAVMASAR